MLTLTPNRRLAAFLTQQYNFQQATLGKPSWETAAIYRLEDWLTELWRCSIESTQQDLYPILSKMQQQILWEQIIQNSNVGVELLRISSTAKNVLQAWKFLNEWQIPPEKLQPYTPYSQDVAAFYIWMQIYFTWLDEHKYLDFALMVNCLTKKLPALTAYLPSEISLQGFDEIPPQYLHFFNALKKLGVIFHEQRPEVLQNEVYRVEFTNQETEIQMAACWAKQELAANPNQILGVVIPQLESQRQFVERIFKEHISADIMNISAPQSLGNYPLINHALLLLQLAKPQLNYSDFSIILRSPYILAATSELTLRASIDRQLRTCVEARLSWSSLSQKLHSYDVVLLTAITALQTKQAGLSGKQHASYWAQQIQEILQIWGWPGDRALSIEEADLFSCWQELLLSYTQLAIILGEHTFAQSLQIIQRLAGETPFLPAETGHSKLQVLGVLEAAGIKFDQLWVSGMSRDNWPPDAAPNPFIPSEILRQYDMPRSSPQRELKLARRLTTTLQHGGEHRVIFSYPLLQDELHTEASNLIVHLPLKIISQQIKPAYQASLIKLESFCDAQAQPIALSQTVGGSNLLKLQAQCPFKAFASIRLDAAPLQIPQLFLSAAQRGNIVHAVMEEFWRQCKTHAQLITWLAELKIEQILDNIILRILRKWQNLFANTISENYLQLENDRLKIMLQQWLMYEAQRSPFTVQHIEQKVQISLGGLQINLRVDRVDQLSCGSLVVIDYKTGYNQIADWFSEPLQEPQMPLYAIIAGEQIVAVVIANLQIAELKFKGVSAQPNVLPDVKELAATRYIRKAAEWGQQLELWHEQITQSALDFAKGVAHVMPTIPAVCETCSLHALCRIYDC